MMENLEVQIDCGIVKGIKETSFYDKDYIAFKGIPYAKPPVGELRFEDPQPPEKWSGVKDCSNFGSNCAQIDILVHELRGSDDCLYLNVYTTALHPKKPKAVMVWIHGGAFVLGSGDDEHYGCDYLVEKDIILVTINYRLGVLGFLNLEDEIAAGNQGLKDQVFALEWIQRNISKFGGDPGNVTIFGESAGSASVHYLAISPMAQGLFHKAILQSGAACNPWASVSGSPRSSAQKLASALGKETDDPKELLKFLRTVDVELLIKTQFKLRSAMEKLHFINAFGPTVDAKSKRPFLPVPIEEAMEKGINVPCMIGYMNDEGLIVAGEPLTNQKISTTLDAEKLAMLDADFENLLLHPAAVKRYKQRNFTVKELKQIYFGNESISTKTLKNFTDLLGDAQFICGIHDMLDIQKENSKFPTYLFKFDCDAGLSLWKFFTRCTLPGTCHSDELGFLFYAKLFKNLGVELPGPEDLRRLLVQRFTELWTNFAKTGNPTPSTTELLPVTWSPINKQPEYNCLKISEELEMIRELNIYDRLNRKLRNKL